jgi:hypothetical protein
MENVEAFVTAETAYPPIVVVPLVIERGSPAVSVTGMEVFTVWAVPIVGVIAFVVLAIAGLPAGAGPDVQAVLKDVITPDTDSRQSPVVRLPAARLVVAAIVPGAMKVAGVLKTGLTPPEEVI